MDLTILFSPIDESIYQKTYAPNSLFKSIRVYGDKMPDYKGAHIAIVGIKEDRGTTTNSGSANGPDEIRKKLYNLKKGTGAYRIVDLGNLKPGIDLDETYVRISEVCRILLENNVLPLILGGTHDLDYGQYRGYEEMEKLISLLNIDAFLDLDDHREADKASQHIHKILLHEPNYLLSYTHLAHQLYLIDPASAAILEKLYFEAFRIGQMRTNLAEMEPAIRNADLMSFDITAIRSSDAPGNANAQPFGLTGEEACQLCWYAGMNEKLSSAGFYEYNPNHDDANKKTASVIATMIWYFIEGFYHRKHDTNFRSNDFLKYVVAMAAEPESITFYKSKITEKWWMEVAYHQPGARYARNSIIPCSYNDYQTATKGDVPERYISTLAKLI
ncbi:MAG TPA: formiminoglutamase [Cytophagales bacterium]|nr:formiminoglutamase [Cytophagales bacterium]HRG08582.1 formimidoylglutamase [Cyclobacteriaceae bacterium]